MRYVRIASRLAAFVATIAVVLGIGAFGIGRAYARADEAKVPNYQYKLTETGTYAGDASAIEFDDEAAVVPTYGGYQLVGKDGRLALEGKVFASVEYWGKGVYLVEEQSYDVNRFGFANMDLAEVLPCEAALMVSPEKDKENVRFVEVVYSTGETYDPASAFFHVHEGVASMGDAEEEDELHMGYGRVFDLSKGAFVEGVQIDTPQDGALVDMGASFAVTQGEAVTIFDESGNELWHKDTGAKAYARCVIWKDGDKTQIIDSKGKGRYAAADELSDLASSAAWWSGDYVSERVGTKCRAIDFEGERVFKQTFESISTYCNGLFAVNSSAKPKAKDTTYSVVGMDGTVVATNVSRNVHPIVEGYNLISMGKDEVAIVKGTEIIWQGDEDSDADDLVVKRGSGNKLRTLNKITSTVELDEVETLDAGLVSGRGEGGQATGLYDLFTGEQLLKDEYDEIDYAGGCVFAHKDGQWTIYDVELQKK